MSQCREVDTTQPALAVPLGVIRVFWLPAEVGDLSGCEVLKGMRDVAEEQASGAKGLQRLKAKLWDEVQHVRQLTGAVEGKVRLQGLL